MKTITVPKADRGYTWGISLETYSGDIRNLSGQTGFLHAWLPGVPDTKVISGAIAVVNATSGTITYTLQSGDFLSCMTLYAEIELSPSAAVKESFETFAIFIAESA